MENVIVYLLEDQKINPLFFFEITDALLLYGGKQIEEGIKYWQNVVREIIKAKSVERLSKIIEKYYLLKPEEVPDRQEIVVQATITACNNILRQSLVKFIGYSDPGDQHQVGVKAFRQLINEIAVSKGFSGREELMVSLGWNSDGTEIVN
jgi:hypothetical protein